MRSSSAREIAKALTITPNEARKHGLDLNQDGVRRSAFDLLAYPDIDLIRLRNIWPELGAIDGKVGGRGLKPRRAMRSISTGRQPTQLWSAAKNRA